MKEILIIFVLYIIYFNQLVAQCGFVLMHDTSSTYLSQLAYTEETESGFRTYMRKYFNPQVLDDPRNGIYLQERDECMNLVREEVFMRIIDMPERVFHPKDWLYIFPSRDTNYLWISSGSICIKFNRQMKSYIAYPKFDSWIDVINVNISELEESRFGYSIDEGVYILDSSFKVQKSFRTCRSPLNNYDSGRHFFAFLPILKPLFSVDSSIYLMDIDGNVKWKFTYDNGIPYFLDWHYSSDHYYLIGWEALDVNNVTSNPVVYKLDKEGRLILKKFITTTQFRAAEGTRCLVVGEFLYICGWQTISRRPTEVKQNFIAKLDADLNLLWKIDLEQVCGPRVANCTSIKQTKDGGALFTYLKVEGADTCNPLFVKVDPNGIINAMDDQSSSSAYRAFPNPVMDELQIAGLDLNLLDIVELVDIMGNWYPVSRLGDRLNMSMVPAGIYFIKIKERGKAAEVLKIVKI